mmetsp:Transcript_20687/g.63285  ORF Transcript_20687/g.63285 Transcript_20687/m.63285 type:complete len:251 (+) Transcript_20687:1197-1949(+)
MVATRRTFSSDFTYSSSVRTARRAVSSAWISITSGSGVRVERLCLSRSVRPFWMTPSIIRTSASMTSSTAAALTSGIMRKWTDSRAPGTTSLRFWYMCSAKKGVSGAIMRQSIIITSKSVFSDACRSSPPASPANRSLFMRMYQLVRSSMSSTSRGTTVYRRYASISVRMNLTRPFAAARIQRSIRFLEARAMATSGEKGVPSCFSIMRMDPTSIRYAWYQGRKMDLRFCNTPASLKQRSSARTTGELIR